ncbi:S-layer homology domain-containing protein [Paenibacillus sp. FSL K6-1318]|uniref:S-layer homology domain-containing protein n=1 Tax=Paenibacillus sp. FSL K6-1318 TaxID=2975291 RepID=UPI0030ECB233
MRQHWIINKKRWLISLVVIMLFVNTYSAAGAYEESEVSSVMTQNPILFKTPVALAINDQGMIHVADYGNNRIVVLDPVGRYVAEWGGMGSGNGQFNYPSGIAFDSHSNVYVVDRQNHRIQKFDANGNYLAQWGTRGNGDGQFLNPSGIAIASNDILYVSDRDNQRIQRFDTNGNFLGQWGSLGNGDGQFSHPYGIAIDRRGHVYVADAELHRIQEFDANGVFLNKWGSQGTGDGQFRYPFDITVDNRNGHIYVPDAQNNRIQKFDLDGNFISQWGSAGIGDGQFSFPNGVALDRNGDVYVSEATNHQVQKFNANGNFLNRWSGTITVPEAPVNVTAEPGNGQATVSFAPPISNGNHFITGYEVITYPGGLTTEGSGSPITVSGLTNGESYAFTVRAINSAGISAESTVSDNITPYVLTYKVQLDAQGGTVHPTEQVKQYHATYGEGSDGVTVDRLPKPERGGYAFEGWFTEADGAGLEVTNTSRVTRSEDHTLYAKWTLNYPSIPVIRSVEAGDSSVTLKWQAVPYADGYNLYQRTETGSYGAPIVIADSSVLHYTYEKLTNGTRTFFKIEAFNSRGASGASVEVNAMPIMVPTIISVSVPTNGSYTAGDTLNFSIHFSEPVTVNGSPSLELDIGGVIRQANYVSISAPATLNFSYTVHNGDLDSDGISIVAFALNGGTVWGSTGVNAALSLVRATIPSTAGIIVNGHNQYTLRYDGNGNTGGSVTSDIYSHVIGETVRVMGNNGVLTKDGFTFAGWNNSASGNGTDYAPGSTFVMGPTHMTLYAKWNASPPIIDNDAKLANLSLSGVALTPVFSSGVTTYTTNVSSSIKSVVVTAAPSDPNATVVINGQAIVSGSPSQPISLYASNNPVDIVVTAADGVTTLTYSIQVRRASDSIDNPVVNHPIVNNPIPSISNVQTIEVPIESEDGDVLLSVTIIRTTESSDKKKDDIIMTAQQAEQLRAASEGKNVSVARLVLPNEKDEVSEWTANLQKGAVALLANMGIDLEVVTTRGSIHLSKDTLAKLSSDTTFEIALLRSESERSALQQLIETNAYVLERMGTSSISVVDTPVSIKTNVSSLQSEITLPLSDLNISEAEAKNLAVFIKHSDGTVELLRGEVVIYNKSGQQGIRFAMDRFSIFAIVRSEALIIKHHDAYIAGYEDGTFRPNTSITRAEMAVLLSRIFEDRSMDGPSSISFNDVGTSYWAKDAITLVSTNGWMIGQVRGSFLPGKTITRAELATIVARFIEHSEVKETTFTDVRGHWAEVAIAKVQASGMMNGYASGKFRPNSPLTRAEAVVILNKLLGRDPIEGSTMKWNDVAEGFWAYDDIHAASNVYVEDLLAKR